jgi:hypothetical protein
VANASPVLASNVAASDYLGVTVVSLSYSVETYSLAPPSAPPSLDVTAAIVGGVLSGLISVLLCAGLACWMHRKKSKAAPA